MIGTLGFTTPLLLLALLALPILWWLLRAVPPAPTKRRFPGVSLLLGLRDDDNETDKTPWWLLALRILALCAVIIGFAGPVINPRQADTGNGPLLIVLEATWASARDWSKRMERVEDLLSEAERGNRPVAIQSLTDSLTAPEYVAPREWLIRMPSLRPAPYAPDMKAVNAWATAYGETARDVIWFSDGLERERRTALAALPISRIIQSPSDIITLRPATFADGEIKLTATRTSRALPQRDIELRAIGPDPTGIIQQLAIGTAVFEAGAIDTELSLVLPPELRNRVQRFEIAGQRSAGAVALTDDALRRREVGLLTAASDAETSSLLSPLYYLRRALEPSADLIEGTLSDLLLANPDVLILADVANLSDTETADIVEWVEDGGVLVRFSGHRLAASDEARSTEEPLLPVRLRSGGRTVGGALSWGEPKSLRPFSQDSPFFGLQIPQDVTVASQVMAQPDPTLAQRSVAALADGTPLVTRKTMGQGQVVLFHVTANAEWSTLPLSGLFVEMLERLAISSRATVQTADDLAGVTWSPRITLDGFGVGTDASARAGQPGEVLAARAFGAELLPGLYTASDRSVALNVMTRDAVIAPATNWPDNVPIEGLNIQPEQRLMPVLLTIALVLLAFDILASLWIGGRLRQGTTALIALALLGAPSTPAQAQDALAAANEITLGYVITGDARVDDTSRAGLSGLSQTLTRRTSVEPVDPAPVTLETDELAFFPLLYWPITDTQPTPSPEAYAKLNRYLRGGGMIVFDTRDADVGTFGTSPNGRRLQQLAAPLDIPPLEPIPSDHVLTRSFYLLQDFPGRFASRDVWVEASPTAEATPGMPFRTLNDGVSPVIIGGNDWAAAWAVNAAGQPLLPIGRGFAGERQREIANRFGVNLVMHVLSGNYKSDQVHVPALLDRLGQ